MPSSLRKTAAQPAESAQADGPYSIPGLDFNQALTWRAGKALPVADLLSRLQKLGGELRGLEQGQIPAKDFRQLARDLAHSNLLGHKDKGIRAWTLCCIVDILNICAPDAPFNPGQLRDIFKVVNNLLQNLDDPSNAYNAQHIYILNSLTDTKSIVLITDLEKPEELITPLFRICFDIVSGASQNAGGQELAKSVEFQLRSMLVTIMDEAGLSQDAVEAILSQFLRVDPRTQQDAPTKGSKHNVKDKKQDTLHLKDYPPAYNMAKSICTTCTEKMTAYVTQYLGTVIINASASLSDEAPTKSHGRKALEVDDSDGDDDENLADLRKAHWLVRELWRACPDVLINVISQIEAELHADSATLRQLATETLGDIIAGIGIAGPPPTSTLDPSAFPLPSVEEAEPGPVTTNPLLVPASPKPFSTVHASAFQAFLGRRIDKSPLVRNAWAKSIGRILLTDAGGIGVSTDERKGLLSGYAQMLKDMDDKVRHTAVQSVANFSYHTLVNVLGADGGISVAGSVLANLAERVSDRKHNIREDAMSLLGQIWGTGSRDVEQGVESVVSIINEIPTRVCNAMFTNDQHIHLQLDKVLYEDLLPIAFPSAKTGPKGETQKRGKSASQNSSNQNLDHVRVLRILTLVKSLNPKAKQVFFRIQKRQVEMSKAMKGFLKACEDYNGGVVDDDAEEQRLKEQLSKYVQLISKQYPDSSKASADLWKFVKMHDRRNYQLIRFATGPEHDYRTMSRAIKELTKRIKEGTTSTQAIIDTLLPLLYRCALIVYNRTHVPPIMDISRTDEGGLAETAHEVLKEISAWNPEVLKSHIQALCKELEQNAPSASKPESASAADTLKACAGFARKYPAEVPKDRKFLGAMTSFALFSSSPRAAKHAVTIVLTVSDKKEFHGKELISEAVKDCEPDSAHYLARLATISQVCLLAPSAASIEEDAILDIAVTNCLQKNRSQKDTNDTSVWESPPSDEIIAKQLALKVMVNRCRSADGKDNETGFDMLANNVIALLMTLIEKDGEVTPTQDTPPAHRNLLRFTAAHYLIKLCSHKRRCEELVTASMFISVALIVINPPNDVRSLFVQQLQKYLGRTNLHARWYTVFFLLAFEPDVELKTKTVGWLKSRVSFFARQQKQAGAGQLGRASLMESSFARLLSLLAHHPDYPDSNSAEYEGELLDFARYIVFYLQCVASEENISLIFHIAQRVKQTRDAVSGSEDASERLYVLSDLAQAVIRNFADLMPGHAKGVNPLQTWPGKATLPTSLFSALPSSAFAQGIAAKNYLPEDVALNLEKLVRHMVRAGKSKDKNKAASGVDRKRKSDSADLDDSDAETVPGTAKRSKKTRKSSTLPIRKTLKSNSKRKAREADGEMSVEQPSRKSARMSNVKSYAESDEDDNGDNEMGDDMASSPIKAKMSKLSTNGNAKPKNSKAAQTQSDDEDDDAANEVEAEDESSPTSVTEDNGDVEMLEPANARDVDDGDEAEHEGHENQDDTQEDEEDEDEEENDEQSPSPKPLRKKQAKTGKASPPPTTGSRTTRRGVKETTNATTPTSKTTRVNAKNDKKINGHDNTTSKSAGEKPSNSSKAKPTTRTTRARATEDQKNEEGDQEGEREDKEDDTTTATAATASATPVSATKTRGKKKPEKKSVEEDDSAATAAATAPTRRSTRNVKT